MKYIMKGLVFSHQNTKFVTLAAATTTATALVWNTTQAEKSYSSDNADKSKKEFRLEVHLMDKIAEKPYLIQRGIPNKEGAGRRQRPKGVPETLRIIAVDLPEMRRDAFQGYCRVDFSTVFHDGIAPPKLIQKQHHQDDHDHPKAQQKILQKSLAEALLKCRSTEESNHVGAELLEVSIAELNPNNLRKTHSWGNYSYDPGKFARKEDQEQKEEPTMADVDDDVGMTDDDDDDEHYNDAGTTTSSNEINKDDDKEETKKDDKARLATGGKKKKSSSIRIQKMNTNKSSNMVLATEEDELHAPWNQYAWIEEISKRVQGKVNFGAPMEKSSRLSRLIFGNVYKQTVPSSRSYYDWLLPPFLQQDPCGIDGEHNGRNWASQKPHAVIADGAAMQRVPGSAKYLTDCCREADVPLYIINDPRAWGGSTHKDLSDALRDMRRTIKGRIVSRVVQDQDSGAFSRGKIIGQLQTETQWQAREAKRKTQQAIREATEKYKMQKKNDWSALDVDALREKLVEHKLIVMMKKKKRVIPVEQTDNEFLNDDTIGNVNDKKVTQESTNKPQQRKPGFWARFGWRDRQNKQQEKDATTPPDASNQPVEKIVEETSLQMTEAFRQLCREYFEGEEQKEEERAREGKTETSINSVMKKPEVDQHTTTDTTAS